MHRCGGCQNRDSKTFSKQLQSKFLLSICHNFVENMFRHVREIEFLEHQGAKCKIVTTGGKSIVFYSYHILQLEVGKK